METSVRHIRAIFVAQCVLASVLRQLRLPHSITIPDPEIIRGQMGFFTVLRSIEDLLYEIMSWLVFYPRTLWQVIRHPIRMADYSNIEQTERSEQQYTDTLSPPLFLVLTILLGHGVELSFGSGVATPHGALGKLVSGSEEVLMLLLAVLYSLFPLTFAVAFLKRSGRSLDRSTLRAPFFSQCYPASLFAIMMSTASIVEGIKSFGVNKASLAITLFGIVWYLTVQTLWLAEQLAIGKTRSLGIAVLTFFKAMLFSSIVSAILFL
jgi:hypothetical protein